MEMVNIQYEGPLLAKIKLGFCGNFKVRPFVLTNQVLQIIPGVTNYKNVGTLTRRTPRVSKSTQMCLPGA